MGSLVVPGISPASGSPATTPTPRSFASVGDGLAPGVPHQPVELVLEDFQNVAGGDTVNLGDYVGSAGTTYTADPYWLDENYCNGIITRYGLSNLACFNSNPVGDYADRNIQRLAHVLGQVAGAGDPEENFAVSAWTTAPDFDVDPPPDAVEFETETPYTAEVAGRFVNVSVDVGEASCEYLDGVNNARLAFYLLDGVDELPLTSAPIVPCQDPRASTYDAPLLPGGGWGDGGTGVSAGRFYGDQGYLFSGATVGVMMRNETPNHLGNDHAWDNIRLLDASPRLDKAFAAPGPGVDTTVLTFVVTNSAELAAKAGWSFTDDLEGGLRVAASGAASTTCTNGTVVADPGASAITVEGDLEAGETSCEVTVEVTSSEQPASYANCAENITASQGLHLPAVCALVEFPADGEPTGPVRATPSFTG